jgi:CheY-like chemotaxis protein
MKILVCEDDDIVMKVIQVVLKNDKIDVTYVRDGRRALDELTMKNFDLIITDIHMPFYNGDDLLKLVRGDQRKLTPFVMISSDSEEEVIKLALKSGVNEFISKPISTEKLTKALKKFIPFL